MRLQGEAAGCSNAARWAGYRVVTVNNLWMKIPHVPGLIFQSSIYSMYCTFKEYEALDVPYLKNTAMKRKNSHGNPDL